MEVRYPVSDSDEQTMRRGAHSSLLPISLAAVVALASTWVWVGIVDRVDQPFPGFLLLGNGVVASAGLAYWPATTREDLFQAELLAYDDIPYSGADRFFTYVEDLSPGTPIRYQFRRGSAEPFRAEIATRTFTATDATLLFGATFLSAIALLGVALAIRHLAPEDPASGCSLPLGIAGIWALTALDLYGPYHFFRVHAFAECLLAAGSVHMALVFPYQRGIAIQRRWLVPSLYGAGIALGVANQIGLYSPTAYSTLHRTAVAAAGLSFGVLVASQIHAFLRPKSMIARQRVTVLAIGTFFSMGPGLVVLLMGATADSGASENSVAWAGALFPISIAYAVLRADLLEVDSILRRSVTYILVSAIVGLLYALVVAGFESIASGADRIPRWVSILAFSCFCTFALLPIRERIQSIVDRIFFRSVYDFRVITQKTSARLARLIDREAIRAEIEQAVSTALRPEVCELEILAPNEERPRASEEAGETIEDRPDGGIIVRFRSRNRVVAELLLGRRLSGKFFSGEDRDLLAVLANQGAIAIENAHALEEVRELNRTLERRVRDRTAELADTLDQLQETQADLVDAERLAAVGEIAAGVAHEVNNPLNFARNSLRALEALVADVFDSPESRSNGNRSELDSDSAKLASRPSNQSELLQDVGELIGNPGFRSRSNSSACFGTSRLRRPFQP